MESDEVRAAVDSGRGSSVEAARVLPSTLLKKSVRMFCRFRVVC